MNHNPKSTTRSYKYSTVVQSEDNERSDDAQVLRMLHSGKIRHHELEKVLAHPEHGLTESTCARAVRIRRQFMASQMEPNSGAKEAPFKELPHENYDYSKVFGANCENVVGYVQVPVGVVGPFLIDGVEYQVPMATTEGCLVASTQRGAKALSVHGVETSLLNDGMTRAPLVRMPSARHAAALCAWIKGHFDAIASKFNATSRYARLREIKCTVAGNMVFMRFNCTTGDAMGMNMVSKGTDAAMSFIAQSVSHVEVLSLSGNLCTDKKPSAVNWIEGRGKSVVADAVVPIQVVQSVLKTDVDALVKINIGKNLVGSAMAGSIGGFNAHASNVVTAIFLATGQDVAQNVESSNCITFLEKTEAGDLYISCTMPSIEVGTVGGGTALSSQRSCLDLMGLSGGNMDNPGQNAQRLARIICATVLAGELSLLSALSTGVLVQSHERLNRGSKE